MGGAAAELRVATTCDGTVKLRWQTVKIQWHGTVLCGVRLLDEGPPTCGGRPLFACPDLLCDPART